MPKLTKAKMPEIGVEGHWSAIKFSDNILQDALIRHVLGLTYLQMADVGEVFEAVENFKSGTEWIDAWSKMASALEKRAEDSKAYILKKAHT